MSNIIYSGLSLALSLVFPSCNTMRCVPIVNFFILGGETTIEDFGDRSIRIPCHWKLSKKDIAIVPGKTTFSEIRVYRHKTPDSQEWNRYTIFWPSGQFLSVERFRGVEKIFDASEKKIPLENALKSLHAPGIYRLLDNGEFIGEFSYTYPSVFSRMAQGHYDKQTISLKIDQKLKYEEEHIIMVRDFSKTVDFNPAW